MTEICEAAINLAASLLPLFFAEGACLDLVLSQCSSQEHHSVIWQCRREQVCSLYASNFRHKLVGVRMESEDLACVLPAGVANDGDTINFEVDHKSTR